VAHYHLKIYHYPVSETLRGAELVRSNATCGNESKRVDRQAADGASLSALRGPMDMG